MGDDGELREVEFRSVEDVWPADTAGDFGKRDDNYITVTFDMADGTYSLTYHPLAKEVTTNHFTHVHAALALRDAGYAYGRIVELLDGAKSFARRTA